MPTSPTSKPKASKAPDRTKNLSSPSTQPTHGLSWCSTCALHVHFHICLCFQTAGCWSSPDRDAVHVWCHENFGVASHAQWLWHLGSLRLSWSMFVILPMWNAPDIRESILFFCRGVLTSKRKEIQSLLWKPATDRLNHYQPAINRLNHHKPAKTCYKKLAHPRNWFTVPSSVLISSATAPWMMPWPSWEALIRPWTNRSCWCLAWRKR